MTVNWEAIAALYVLDLLEAYKTPQLATDALVAGYNSRSLRILAGESEREIIRFEARRLLKKVFEELGIDIPDREQAIHTVTLYYLQQIVDGEVTPVEGANTIWKELVNGFRLSGELFAFVKYADQYDEARWLPNTKQLQAEAIQGIKERAQELLDEPHRLTNQE